MLYDATTNNKHNELCFKYLISCLIDNEYLLVFLFTMSGTITLIVTLKKTLIFKKMSS